MVVHIWFRVNNRKELKQSSTQTLQVTQDLVRKENISCMTGMLFAFFNALVGIEESTGQTTKVLHEDDGKFSLVGRL